jgi:hypothetical protein
MGLDVTIPDNPYMEYQEQDEILCKGEVCQLEEVAETKAQDVDAY